MDRRTSPAQGVDGDVLRRSSTEHAKEGAGGCVWLLVLHGQVRRCSAIPGEGLARLEDHRSWAMARSRAHLRRGSGRNSARTRVGIGGEGFGALPGAESKPDRGWWRLGCRGAAWPRRRRGAARRGCTVAAARVVRVGSRGSGWFKEPWPKISACGIGRKGCGHRDRGSRGDTARPLQCGEGGGRGRDCQVGPACQWRGARERLSGSLWVGPASHEWRGGVRGWGTSGLCGAS